MIAIKLVYIPNGPENRFVCQQVLASDDPINIEQKDNFIIMNTYTRPMQS